MVVNTERKEVYALMSILREKRIEQKLTQKDLASEMDIDISYISLLENGKRKTSVPLAKKLGKFLDFNWTDFFED